MVQPFVGSPTEHQGTEHVATRPARGAGRSALRPLNTRSADATPGQENLANALVWILVGSFALSSLFLLLRTVGVIPDLEDFDEETLEFGLEFVGSESPVVLVEHVLQVTNLPVEGTAPIAVFAGALAWAGWRRKRVGLLAVITLQVFGLVAALLLGGLTLLTVATEDELFLDPTALCMVGLSGLVAAVTIPILWNLRPAFPGRLRQGSWSTVAATLGIGVSFVVVFVATALFFMTESVSRIVQQAFALLVISTGFKTPKLVEMVPQEARWLTMPVGFLLACVLIAMLYVFLNSPKDRNAWRAGREVLVRKLLTEFGERDSLGYYATRRDKSYVISGNERAVIDYAVIGSVSLASGDPIGDPKYWPDAISRWKAEARYYGWTLAVLGASEEAARAYKNAGLKVIGLGDEAVLEPGGFSMVNTSRTGLRRAVNKLRKAGYTVTISRQSDLSAPELHKVAARSEAWRHGAVERGFSMALGRVADPADADSMIVQAFDPQGVPVGLLTFAPWGRRGLSLDLMRRSPDASNGVTELMVVSLMEAADDHGLTRVSLNFVMFRKTFEDSERFAPGAPTRIVAKALSMFDRFFQLESLYTFSLRFNPQWCPRYLCYDGNLSLASVAIAAGRAEGFLTVPFFGRPGNMDGLALSAADLEEVRRYDAEFRATASAVHVKRSDQTRSRIAKVTHAAERDVSLYPIAVAPAGTVREALDAADAARVRVSGRLRRLRRFGGVIFAVLIDGDDALQVVLERDRLGAESLRDWRSWVSIGDLVVVEGTMGASRSGERSVLVDAWQVAAKALRPIPFESFTDPAQRLRERSLDLLVNTGGAELLRQRSSAVAAVRDGLRDAGFMEVETPMLNTVHGGASARPFTTHINAYSVDLTLRIAPELYLKRLIVGGMGGVFEIGRNFRNEGADATHNPEFTVVEAYKPFSDYNDMRVLVQTLIQDAAVAVHGSAVVPLVGDDGRTVMADISGDWPVVPVLTAVSEALGEDVTLDTDFERLLAWCKRYEVHVRDDMGPGAVIEELYGELVEPHTTLPTFYTDFPVETSPLAGPHRSTPGLAERWDLVAAGTEIGTAYSELTDPLEQRARLTEQSLKAAAGDPEAMEIDEDFLAALELGMPPCGGMGFGIDRMVMLLTNSTIRPVLTFPFVKPERH